VAINSRGRLALMSVPPVLAALGFAWFYFSEGRYQSTDDAFIQTALVSIAANVSGQVVAIEANENQPVRAGTILFRINPESFQTAVNEAEAQLDAARADIRALHANYDQAQSEVEAAQARLLHAQADATRKKALLAMGISSQAQFDDADLAVRTSEQNRAAAHSRSESILASLSGNLATPLDDYPTIRRARAALERAQIALKDTIVRAPMDGIVTRVHQLQLGDYVTTARPVFVLMGKDVWVQANFKESQLRDMRRGQPATVTIDAYPGRTFKTHVASFSPGTGSSLSLLPAENATGNWVKVIQRVPVELAFDNPSAELALQAGLSVEARVDTGPRPLLWMRKAQRPPDPTVDGHLK
jgi:membrane fusion protein (multidrug efflux system)